MQFSKVSEFFQTIINILNTTRKKYIGLNYLVKHKPWYVRTSYIFVKILIIGLLFLFAVDVNLFWLFGRSPRLKDLNNPKLEIASELYSSDSVLIGRYFDKNRTPVTYKEIAPILIKTLVATEDHRFYQHSGIDIKSSVSVFWYMLKGKKRGGSTITQQLVKNLFKTRTNYSKGLLGYVPVIRTIIYKTKEWINALKLEFFYSKEDILTLYLNTVDFGSNSYGIHTASKLYFNTTPLQLNINQCAILVGMLKAPTYFSPVIRPVNCIKRRNTVLELMVLHKVISDKQADSVKNTPLNLAYNINDDDDNAGYFSNAVAKFLKPWLKENGYDLYRDGLKIYSSIDSRLQEYAEEATLHQMKLLQRSFTNYLNNEDPWRDEKGNIIPGFGDTLIKQEPVYKMLSKQFGGNKDSIQFYLNKKHPMHVFTYHGERDTLFSAYDSLRYFNSFLHGALVTANPENGQILTWVGDINYNYFKYDHVKQSKRQPGSTFKTFIYTAAIDKGYAPCDVITDSPVSITYIENGEEKTWSPQNVTCEFTGDTVTLKHAFARSINSVAIKLTKEMGWQKVIEYAHHMGITSKLNNVPSVAIGSSDVSLFELVNAYCPLINNGYRVEPLIVLTITDQNGKILQTYNPQKTKIISNETAFLMVQMLRGGLSEPHATTQALFAFDLFKSKIEFGGKTGTSQNYSDGWFVGVTPKLVGGAWVGGEYRSIHFKSNTQGEGCHTALPIFGRFMEKVLKDKKYDYLKVAFEKPKQKINRNYSCHTVLKRDSISADSIPVDSLLVLQ